MAFESGYKVAADSVMRTRLPSAAPFSEATLDPEEPGGVVRFDLPMAVRVGVELRDEDHWRFELAWVWENWSVHDLLELDVEDTVIRNVVGIGDYRLTKVEIPRYLSDTWSLRAGLKAGFQWSFRPLYAEDLLMSRRPSKTSTSRLCPWIQTKYYVYWGWA